MQSTLPFEFEMHLQRSRQGKGRGLVFEYTQARIQDSATGGGKAQRALICWPP